MYRKLEIKHLAILFALLLGIVIFVKLADNKRGGRTFRNNLVKINQEQVTAIEISPKTAVGKTLRLFQENDTWMVESNGKKYLADPATPGSLTNELNNASPERVVATGKDRWEQYEVGDSTGTRVKVYEGSNLTANLIIGKFSFSQTRKMTTYARIAGEKEVYGIKGFMAMSFNRKLDDFRKQIVLQSSSSDWKRLTFTYPADSSFVMEKTGEDWTVNGQPADSASVADYFNDIKYISENRFAEETPSGSPTHLLKIEGDNQMTTIEIKGFYKDDDNFAVESSQNKGNFFNNKDLTEKLFVPSSRFLEQ